MHGLYGNVLCTCCKQAVGEQFWEWWAIDQGITGVEAAPGSAACSSLEQAKSAATLLSSRFRAPDLCDGQILRVALMESQSSSQVQHKQWRWDRPGAGLRQCGMIWGFGQAQAAAAPPGHGTDF